MIGKINLCLDSDKQRKLKILNCGIRMEGVFEDNIKGKIKEIIVYHLSLVKNFLILQIESYFVYNHKSCLGAKPLETNRVEISNSSFDDLVCQEQFLL